MNILIVRDLVNIKGSIKIKTVTGLDRKCTLIKTSAKFGELMVNLLEVFLTALSEKFQSVTCVVSVSKDNHSSATHCKMKEIRI